MLPPSNAVSELVPSVSNYPPTLLNSYDQERVGGRACTPSAPHDREWMSKMTPNSWGRP